MNKVKARYTLSDNKTIYISKNKSYDLHHDGNGNYIYDNTGEKYYLNQETLATRIEAED